MEINILYVEDDELIREELGGFLRRYVGGELYLAADGEEGLELFLRHRPDLVVTDIIMPRMDGLEMIRRIREVDGEVPVLMVTANSDSDFFAESIELQVNGYIPKPIDLDLLDHKIAQSMREIELRRSLSFQKGLLEEIAQLQGSMLAVLDGEFKPIFLNNRMMEFLGISQMDGSAIAPELFWQRVCGQAHSSGETLRYREILERLDARSVVDLHTPDGEIKHFSIDVVRVESTDHTLLTFSEVTELMRERSRYEYRAYHDTLTGLGNRFKCDQDMVDGLFDAVREGNPFSLAVIDLDYFKSVNDRFGHLCGDEVLSDFARYVKELLEEETGFYRWGGEEFVLLMPGRDLQSARVFCERLRKEISRGHFCRKGISLSASFGVAEMRGREETPMQIFDRADKALYHAKKSGRDRVYCAE